MVFKKAAIVAWLCATMGLGLTLTAEAAVITRSFTVGTTPTFETRLNTTIGGPLLESRYRLWVLGSSFDPFTLAAGDTLITTVTFDAPLSIINPTSLGDEAISLRYTSGETAGPGGWLRDHSISITIDGAAGGFLGTPSDISDSFVFPEGLTIAYSQFTADNLTDSSMTLTGFTITNTVNAIDPHVPFDSLSMFILDDGISVPAPGALALLGFGLLGLAGRRRTA